MILIIHVSSLGKCPALSPDFYLGYLRVLCVFWMPVLYLMCVLQNFPPHLRFAFCSSSQCILQFFTLMGSCLSVLPLMDSACGVLSKTSLLNPRSPRFSFTLFSRSFIIFMFYV